MSILVLPQSMVADREAGIKANAQHVDDNFDALTNAVNGKLDLDGSSTPTADISMGSHKLTNLATPTASGDAATKGYTDSALLLKADLASPTFTGTPTAPTVASVADNSTKIATTEFVVDVLKTIYPVGSMFMGTGASCPLSSLFGTWDLVASNVVISVNSTAQVKGTGKSLGFYNNMGLGNFSSSGLGMQSSAFDKNNGTSISESIPGGNTKIAIGVTTDGTKSGLTATVTSSSLTANIWKRSA